MGQQTQAPASYGQTGTQQPQGLSSRIGQAVQQLRYGPAQTPQQRMQAAQAPQQAPQQQAPQGKQSRAPGGKQSSPNAQYMQAQTPEQAQAMQNAFAGGRVTPQGMQQLSQQAGIPIQRGQPPQGFQGGAQPGPQGGQFGVPAKSPTTTYSPQMSYNQSMQPPPPSQQPPAGYNPATRSVPQPQAAPQQPTQRPGMVRGAPMQMAQANALRR